MKKIFYFLTLLVVAAFFSSTCASAQEADLTQPKHVGIGTYDCAPPPQWTDHFTPSFSNVFSDEWFEYYGTRWLHRSSQNFFPIPTKSSEEPVFTDEYAAFLNDVATKRDPKLLAYLKSNPWAVNEEQQDVYLEPSFMEDNTINLDGSLSLTAPASEDIAIWRLSFPSIPNMPQLANLYAYQLVPGRENYIVDGVKRRDVAMQFEAWRSATQWRSHPVVRVLIDYINFQIAAAVATKTKEKNIYQENVTILRDSYLHQINGKDFLIFNKTIPCRSGTETTPVDEWQKYFDACDQLVQNILANMNNPQSPYNAAFAPDLALFYKDKDANGSPTQRNVIEFSASPDPTLPSNMPLHAVLAGAFQTLYPAGANQAIGYMQPDGAPDPQIATWSGAAEEGK